TSENGYFNNQEDLLVRYGDYSPGTCVDCFGHWTYKYFYGNSGLWGCNNTTFGGDPFVNDFKRCEKLVAGGNVPGLLANEGDNFPQETQLGTWVGYYILPSDGVTPPVGYSKPINAGDKCNNDTFGDPMYGTPKFCFIARDSNDL